MTTGIYDKLRHKDGCSMKKDCADNTSQQEKYFWFEKENNHFLFILVCKKWIWP